MSSHVNAHNTPVPARQAAAPQSSRRRRLTLAIFGAACFVLLDRAAMLMVPESYRSIPDRELYHTLDYSLKFREFEIIRGRVETVVLGDSRARHGLDPGMWEGAGGPDAVAAFNFSPASSGIDFSDLLVRKYLEDLPELKTVVWGISPRIFNQYWSDRVYDLFRASPGYKHDLLVSEVSWGPHGEGTALRLAADRALAWLSAAYEHRSILKPIVIDALPGESTEKRFTEDESIPVSPWGAMLFPASRTRDMTDSEEAEKALRNMEGGRFRLAARRFQQFKNIVERLDRRGIGVVCFIPPMHPRLASHRAADADGTPDAAYARVAALLKGMESEFAGFHFFDIHNGGAHEFAASEFGDFDHVNEAGRRRLTSMLGNMMGSAVRRPQGSVARRPGPFPEDDEAGARTAAKPSAVKGAGDATPPEVSCHLGRMEDGSSKNYEIGAFPPDNRPEIWAEFADGGSGVDPGSIRLFMDGIDITAKCRIVGNRITYQSPTCMTPDDVLVTYKFKVMVQDKAGNKAEFEWTLVLKPC